MGHATQFAHRVNRDSSFDSICRTCYQTIGHRDIEAELEIDEKKHICKGFPYSGVSAFHIEQSVQKMDNNRTHPKSKG